MGSDYNSFLAAEVLGDEKLVTYRLVARTMKVQANEAKKMLYEFHRRENAKRAGSVHATYLLSGFKKRTFAAEPNGKPAPSDGEDVEMRSSPFPGSSVPQEAEAAEEMVRTLTLIQEEQLEVAKAQFSRLTGVHVYSLQSSRLNNMETIADVNEKTFNDYIGQDPFKTAKTYGLIYNPLAKRRTGARPPPPPEVAPLAAKPKSAPKAPSSQSQTASKESHSPAPDITTSEKAPTSSAPKSTSKPPTLKKESSSIFASFAKAKPSSKAKASPANDDDDDDDVEVNPGGPVTDSSARGTHSMAVSSLGKETEVKQDVHMTEDDEEGGDDDESFVAPKSGAPKERKTRAEKEEELKRKMFEDDDEDEEMPDAPAEEKFGKEQEEEEDATPAEEPAEEEDEKSQDVEEKPAKEEEEEEQSEEVTVSNGRRRGKRRIMRKRMIKDAEGYLVSREEPGWESFSEEDVPVAKPKTSKPPVSSTASKKGQAGKKGQGSIMSFFGKR